MKGKIACVIMLFVVSAIGVLGGIWQTGIYYDLTNKCTSQVTGTVVEEFYCDQKMSDSVETKYVSGPGPRVKYARRIGNKWLIHIDIQTDDLFKTEDIYADSGTEDEGDTVIIHYDPDDPENYYIGDRVDEYKGSGIFSYAMGGVMFVFAILSAIFIFHSAKANQVPED